MLNFGASKPRVKGGGRAPGAPPGSAPGLADSIKPIVYSTFYEAILLLGLFTLRKSECKTFKVCLHTRSLARVRYYQP